MGRYDPCGANFCFNSAPLIHVTMTPQNDHWLVFTDLDGTLLDHDTYDWSPARPALEALGKAGISVIPISSKTLAELEPLCKSLGLEGPKIAETGAVISYPGEAPKIEPPGYAEIRSTLLGLRARSRWKFKGFGDMEVAEVSRITGLRAEEAARAVQRLATEPILWQDSEESLNRFVEALESGGLCVQRGGRFLHVTGSIDKGRALRAVAARLSPKAKTIALGDSPNDRAMLLAADVPIVVQSKHSGHMPLPERPNATRTALPGPAGWNRAIIDLLEHVET